MKLSRRRFLQAVGAGTALMPFWNPWMSEAYGQTGSPKRVLFYMLRDGTRTQFRPALGSTETDFVLNSFEPLERHRSDLLVLNDFYNPFDIHLHGNSWPMGCWRGIVVDKPVNSLPGGPTIDRVLAQHIGVDTPVDSLSLSLWSRKLSHESSDGERQTFPTASDPIAVFDSLFGGMDSDPDSARARMRRNESVLDALRGDISRLDSRLAANEKEKLDRYVSSVGQLEERLRRLTEGRLSCDPTLAYTQDQLGDDRDNRAEAKLDLTIDITLQAMACGLTNVAFINCASGGDEFIDTGGVTIGHSMWHGDGTDQSHDAFYRFHAEKMAGIWDRLKATPDGDGTMADSTLLVFLNKNGGVHHHGAFDYWFMTLGALGGTLNTGRMLAYGRSDKEDNDPRLAGEPEPNRIRDYPLHATSDFFVSVAQAVGAPVDTFGEPSICQGPLQNIFT